VVRSDQQSLKFLLEQRVVGGEYQKWITKLMSFDFEIQFRSGASNRVADALSRKLEVVEVGSLIMPQWVSWPELRRELASDSLIKSITDTILKGEKVDGFTLQNGVLFYTKRLVIPKNSTLKQQFYMNFMLHFVVDIRVKLKHIKELNSNSFGREWAATYVNMSRIAKCAKETRLKIQRRPGYSNQFLYQNMFGTK
jgi:hypothetical protein